MVYILLGKGFEEIEAIAPCDILRRGGVEVSLCGINGKTVTGSHGIAVEADCTLDELDMGNCEMLVLPGGLGGVKSIRASEKAMQAVKDAAKRNKFVAAICAAPSILAELNITDGKDATCYPGFEEKMGTAKIADADAVRDGKIICGRAAGAAIDFGLALLAALKGTAAAEKVKKEIVYGK